MLWGSKLLPLLLVPPSVSQHKPQFWHASATYLQFREKNNCSETLKQFRGSNLACDTENNMAAASWWWTREDPNKVRLKRAPELPDHPATFARTQRGLWRQQYNWGRTPPSSTRGPFTWWRSRQVRTLSQCFLFTSVQCSLGCHHRHSEP